MKKLAIFDIDGTIFRSSLLIELTDALIQEDIFPEKAKNTYARAYNNWLNRKGSYEKYIEDVVKAFEKNIKGVDYDEFLQISKEVAGFHKSRIYRYSQKIIKDLKTKNYYFLAISGSPKAIVEEFCKNFEFDKIYGRMYEVDKKNKFTGKGLYTDLINDKSKILKRAVEEEELTLKNSIGMGDTETDINFLKMVEKPICFNPNKKLYQYAKKAGWKIIVERKDVIYHL